MDENDRWPPPPDAPEDDRDEGGFAGRVIPDLFRRALMTGIGTVFMTEEGIKNALGDLKMPKEAYGYVISQADRTKRELIATLARELRGFLDNLELDELLRRSFEDTTFDIHTTITVRRADDGEPKVEIEKQETSVTRKKTTKKKKRKSTKKKASKKKGSSETSADTAANDD